MHRNLFVLALLAACSPAPGPATSEPVDAREPHIIGSVDAMLVADATPLGTPSVPVMPSAQSAPCELFHESTTGTGTVLQHYAASFPMALDTSNLPMMTTWMCGYRSEPLTPNSPPFPSCVMAGFYATSTALLVWCGVVGVAADGSVLSSTRADTVYVKIAP